eukprot:TRINITY_DN12161_c0_g1_i1.p3 TRINITY_DN12161_c0_g1~~TRINITY_DN12161_c0_g1_i1.p3  ORF type:complete len:103 (-),score=9.98 TRINITY_DN12161_c0_g1_i1:149-457(-)
MCIDRLHGDLTTIEKSGRLLRIDDALCGSVGNTCTQLSTPNGPAQVIAKANTATCRVCKPPFGTIIMGTDGSPSTTAGNSRLGIARSPWQSCDDSNGESLGS